MSVISANQGMNLGASQSQFALDMQGLSRIKHSARQDPEGGKQAAARQFEALFLQMMMKSMREAVPSSGLMDNKQTQMFTSLLDQQWAQELSGRGIGLADTLLKQLGGGAKAAPSTEDDGLIAGIPRGTPQLLSHVSESHASRHHAEKADGRSLGDTSQDFYAALELERAGAASINESVESKRSALPHVQDFIARLSEPAQRASERSGVPAELILAQAALETGWGSRGIPTRDGGESHNLFGIKAGSRWQGDTTDIVTHEFIGGQRREVVDRFRVYDSFEDAFTDYASLIGNNARYQGVVQAPNAQEAARALQRGGYATDPAYADKLIAVMRTLGPLGETSLLASR
ncbi:flagellar assembly peptidoglycan hydrolase FlgJ [Pistricoccus aurantiacus]|nr:flagellar assembly peptidoglycan hydrolase FlgJ [Pistricoccus aurantiacus]